MPRPLRHASPSAPFLFALFSLLALLPAAARAEGALRAIGPHGADEGLFPLTRTEVRADVSGQVTQVTVAQRYHNAFSQRIEAVYVFPLPDGAAVDEMEMRVGARVVRALVRRRGEAREAYDRALSQGQRAALLEQERPNIFTFSVANIDPGADVEVRLRYFEMARYDHGTYEMVFPMVVGPRYIPGAALAGPQAGTGTSSDTDRVPDASRVSPAYMPPGTRSGHAISLAVHLDAGAELATLEAPAHDVTVARPDGQRADVALRDKDEIPNRDFVLRWTLAAPELRTSVLAHRPDAQTPGYVALSFEPRHDAPVGEIAPRELFFLLDTSGSMQGEPLNTAIAAVRRALATLHPDDTFQLIDFADSASSFAPQPLSNTPENVRRANEYLDHLGASGGTNQLAGIHAALSAPGDARRLRYVVFMTDGYIGDESEVIGLTQREIGNARIFGLGIGSSVNRFLLDEVSLAGRGVAEYLRPNEDATALVERFYQRIARPYLTDITVDWGALGVQDVYPRRVPDLSTFQPLVLFGRYTNAGRGTVTVRGRVGGRPFVRTLDVTLPAVEPGHEALSRVWAREKIAQLSRDSYRQGETAALTEEITRVALSHHLVSQYTSLVAVDEVTPANGARGARLQVNQPAEAPQGVNVAAAGGRAASRASASGFVSPFGGLGASGSGWGGGGTGEGTIGLGNVGSIGHGAGAGTGQGYGAGAGRGLRGRGSEGPMVRAAPPAVMGSLSPEVIRRVVLRNLGQVQHCYEQGLATNPSLPGGRVVVRFVIGANGDVMGATIAETTLGNAPVEQCVTSALQRWHFPALAGGGVVTVNYPFNFAAPDSDSEPAPQSGPEPALPPWPSPDQPAPAQPAPPRARPAHRSRATH